MHLNPLFRLLNCASLFRYVYQFLFRIKNIFVTAVPISSTLSDVSTPDGGDVAVASDRSEDTAASTDWLADADVEGSSGRRIGESSIRGVVTRERGSSCPHSSILIILEAIILNKLTLETSRYVSKDSMTIQGI